MILVTGANGGLGRLVGRHLTGLTTNVLLGSRTSGDRRIDFDDPQTLAGGPGGSFAGVRTLLLISAGAAEDDTVTARHDAVITAAVKAGVEHVIYTSLSGDGDHLAYALAHRWTERRLRASGLRWTILRNGLYAEFLAAIAAPGADGRITAPLAGGRLAAVARDDLAEAAARVAAAPERHAGKVYELVGETALGGAELAAATGTEYAPAAGLAGVRAALTASGGPLPFQVPMLMSTYSAIAGGFLDGAELGARRDLRELLGRAPQDAGKAYAEAVGRG